MSESQVALLSPVSDVAFGSAAPIDVLFGRNGNDVFQGFDPANNDRTKPDLDIFFGDLFDNTVPEYLLILAIQGKLDPRLPPDTFAILNSNTLTPLGLPTPTPSSAGSLGTDRFLLGDVFQPYYTSFDPLSRITTDPFGFDQFALIYDFDPSKDTIQLNGKKGDYFLLEIDELADPTFGPTPFSGQAIFSLQQGIPDLVGLVVSPPGVDLDFNADYFRFVGNKPPKKPENKKIGQLSTNGIDTGAEIAVDPSGNIYVTGTTSGNLFGTSKGFSDAFLAKYDTNANQVSGRQIGTAAGDAASRVVTDAQGNYYLAGSTGGDLFGKQRAEASSEAWVAKYNKDGVLQWGRQFALPGAFDNGGFGLQVDNSGNVFLSGLGIKEIPDPNAPFPAEDDSWLTKYDSQGNLQWTREIGTPFFHENYNLAVDNSETSNYKGSSYLVGWTQGLLEESDPERQVQKYDAWLAQVDTNGNPTWAQQLSSSNQGLEFAQAIDTDSKGNIYISGWTTGLVGTQVGERDLFIAKFDPKDGTLLKAVQFGSVKDDGMYFGDLVIENDQIYLTGHTNGQTGKDGSKADVAFDALVGKFDTNLNNLWLRRFGDRKLYDNATGIDVSGGQVYVTGFSEGFLGQNAAKQPGGSFDAWIAQLNANNGKVNKFSGNDATSVDFEAAESAPITDITSSLETKEELPQGDFKIDPTGGRSTGQLDYGDLLQSFGKTFDPTADNSVQSVLMDAIMNDDLSVFGDNVQGLKLEGTDGKDSLMGLVGDDQINGKAGDDNLSGLAGNDKLVGGNGNDTLIGGAGSDELDGGQGKDRLTGVNPDAAQAGSGELGKLKGGAGEDLFVLGDTQKAYYLGQLNSDYALIEDFNRNQLDKIQLHGSAGDYRIDTDLSGLPTGDAIVSSATNDLIGIVKDVKGLSLTDQSVFTFA
jgi:hypothetical protein